MNKEEILKDIAELERNIGKCIGDLVGARLEKDKKLEAKMQESLASLAVKAQQELSFYMNILTTSSNRIMNEKLNLCKILKDVPVGTELWSPVYGKVRFSGITESSIYPVKVEDQDGDIRTFTSDGKFHIRYDDTECVIFPSKDQRDWSKFGYKPEPKKVKVVLHPFDKVLIRDEITAEWRTAFFSHIYNEEASIYKYATSNLCYKYCIPYNKDTAHLVGTDEDCPIDYEIEFCKDYKEE